MSGITNLARSLHEHSLEHPERLAIALAGRELSYAELAASAGRIAAWLQRASLPPNCRVGVLAGRGTVARGGIGAREGIVAHECIMGAAWAGAAYVPLRPDHPDAHLTSVIERAELSVLIVDEVSRERAEALVDQRVTRILAPASDSDLARIDSFDAPTELASGVLAYVMFTSGTTGVPKGVLVTVANVHAFLRAVGERYELDENDRLSQFFDLTFDLSVFDLFAGFGAGASLHVVPEAQRMAPVPFARERALTVWFSVPSTLADAVQLKALQPAILPALRLSLFCGEPLPAACAMAWREAAPNSLVENLYGPTEVTVACLVESCKGAMAVTAERGVVAIGRPFPGTEAAIHDPRRGFLDPGETGELLLSGVQVSDGYWRDASLTSARYPELEHPTLGRRTWYRTGDLARQDTAGRFHHLGRTDHQIKLRGQRVELEAIEAHLREATGSAMVAAVAWPMRDGSALGLVAFLSGSRHPVKVVRDRLRALLPAALLPRRFVELESLPRATSGKLDRRALISLLEDRSPDGADGP